MTSNVGNLLLEAPAPPGDAGVVAQTSPSAEGSGDEFAGLVKALLENTPDAETDSARAGQQASCESKKEDEGHTTDVLMASLLGSSESGRQMLAQVAAASNMPDPPTNVEPAQTPAPLVSAQTAVQPVEVSTREAIPVAGPDLAQPDNKALEAPPAAVASGQETPEVQLPDEAGQQSPTGEGVTGPETAPVQLPDEAEAEAPTGKAAPEPQMATDRTSNEKRPENRTGQAPEARSDAEPPAVPKDWNPRSAASVIDPPAAWRRDQVDGTPANVRADPDPGEGPARIALIRGFNGKQATDADPAAKPDLQLSPLLTQTEKAAELPTPPISQGPKQAAAPAWIAFTRRPEWIHVQALNTPAQAGIPLPSPTAGSVNQAATLLAAKDTEPVKGSDSGNRTAGDPGHGRFESLFSDPSLTGVSRPENAASPERLVPAREVSAQVINQIVRTAKTHVFDGGAAMTLRLDPPHLGALEMTVTTTQGAVTAALRASSETTRELLQANIGALKEALAQSGINVDAINVSVGTGHEQGWNLPGRHGEQGNGYGNSNAPWGTPANDSSDDREMAVAAAGTQPNSGYGFDYLA